MKNKIMLGYFKDICAYVFVPLAAMCWLFLVIIQTISKIATIFEIIHIPMIMYGVYVLLRTGYDKYHRRQKGGK